MIQPICSDARDGQEAQLPLHRARRYPLPPPLPSARLLCCALLHFACCCGGIGPGPAGRGSGWCFCTPRPRGRAEGLFYPFPSPRRRCGQDVACVCVSVHPRPLAFSLFFYPVKEARISLPSPSLALRLADARSCGRGLPASRRVDGGDPSCASPSPSPWPPRGAGALGVNCFSLFGV